MSDKPKFQHDCNKCHFLGHWDAAESGPTQYHDLYWCASVSSPNLCSLIARYGNEGPEYRSGLPPEALGEGYEPPEIELGILARALTAGLYKPWERFKQVSKHVRMAAMDLRCDDPKQALAELQLTGLVV